jgi:hypothetical protein
MTISGAAPQAGEDVGERSVDPGEGVGGALEAPTGRVLRPKRSKILASVLLISVFSFLVLFMFFSWVVSLCYP